MNDSYGTQRVPMRGGWMLPALVLALAGLLFYQNVSRPLARPNATPRAVTPRADLADDEKTTIEIFQNAAPSVVYITTKALRRDFFRLNVFEIPQGTGSGFVWDDQGHIVTNFHVIQSADSIEVTLQDQTSYKATLVGQAPDNDLAVLRIDAPDGELRPIPVGTSADLVVGQSVFAIGNPFGLDRTLTTGIVSALNRTIQSVTRMDIDAVIQTDAAINPGNSGGPLLDSAGRLIGVNTAIYSPSGSSAGIGFAVPVDAINEIVPQLIEHGRRIRPGLGFSVHQNNDLIMQRLGITGVLVYRVHENTAAERAGLRGVTQDQYGDLVLGDVIQKIGDYPIKTYEDLRKAMDKFNIGDTVNLTILRERKQMTVEATLQSI